MARRRRTHAAQWDSCVRTVKCTAAVKQPVKPPVRGRKPRTRQKNPRVVLYAKHRKTGAVLRLVRKGKFSDNTRRKPFYFNRASDAQLAAWAYKDEYPNELKEYELFWQ